MAFFSAFFSALWRLLKRNGEKKGSDTSNGKGLVKENKGDASDSSKFPGTPPQCVGAALAIAVHHPVLGRLRKHRANEIAGG
jgi:hypothetical protein